MSDKQVWHYEQNGIFSTNSAYYLAKREVDAGTSGSNSQDSLVLKKLWNACVPGKPETVEHVLRDCSMARAIWFASLGIRGRDNSLVCFRDWVTKLAHDSSKLTFDLMLTTIWSIWRARNDLLWKGTISHPRDVALRAEEWMLAFRHYHSPSKMVSMQTIQKWYPSDIGFLKCNFDGAWDERSRKCGVGVIIRNCSGEFLAGLAAIEEDVGLALQEELLAARFVHATTSFIRREGNSVAYRLARAGLRGTWKSIWAENPPDMLADVLIEESSHRNLS
ncbi:hypothetical protein ACFX1X_026667 [Malus domestica]